MKVLSTSHLGFIVKDLNTIINFLSWDTGFEAVKWSE